MHRLPPRSSGRTLWYVTCLTCKEHAWCWQAAGPGLALAESLLLTVCIHLLSCDPACIPPGGAV